MVENALVMIIRLEKYSIDLKEVNYYYLIFFLVQSYLIPDFYLHLKNFLSQPIHNQKHLPHFHEWWRPVRMRDLIVSEKRNENTKVIKEVTRICYSFFGENIQ